MTELAKLDRSLIDKSFPKESYREGQKEAIEFAIDAFNSGKRFVILECPTGSGKSPIGLTVADMVPESYYLTVTKILQDQLVSDFGRSIVELKGRNAYPCTYYDRYGQRLVDRKLWTQEQLKRAVSERPTCATGFCKTKTNRDQPGADSSHCKDCFPVCGPRGDGKSKGNLDRLPFGMHYAACPYYEQVYKAMESRKVVMNFSSFLYQTTLTKRFEIPRDLMIIDECHNIESQLLDFVCFSLNDLHLQKLGIFIPELQNPYDYYLWFREIKVAEYLSNAVKQAVADENSRLEDELIRLAKKYQLFVHRIENTEDERATEWVTEYEEKKNSSGEIMYRTVTIKPVYVYGFAHDLLFKYAHRILMMSATVLDVNVMSHSLGLRKEEIAAKRLKNRFPAANRPIYLRPVAKMTGGKEAMTKWAPQLVEGVDEIVDQHAGQRGIIHTHNFAIMEHLLIRCRPSVKDRLLCQRDFFDKTEMLAEHARRDDSVIVAPAMHEGVDLIDDLSRFQIICKVPYANFYDNKQLARRIEIDRRYYTWLTALKLVQSYGRSIRSDTDHAVTYILDESIYKFLKDAKSMLPGWFLEAIQDARLPTT